MSQDQSHGAHTTATPKIGFEGTGAIAEALVVGLCNFGETRAEILLSPRNATTAERLASKFPSVRVAPSNQAVVDRSEIVFLAVRPQVAEEVLTVLRFRPEQRIVSLIATFDRGRLRPLVAPATAISRAVPLPPVAERRGPLALLSGSPEVERLLDGLGRLICIEDEAQLDLLSAATSLMGTYFGLMESVDGWLTGRGFDPGNSRVFVAELFGNLAQAAREHPEESFARLSRDYSTPGGLNEQAWRELKAIGWGGDVQRALDLVLERIAGRATFHTQLQRP